MEEKFCGEGGLKVMDELYTVEEMMKILKVSRGTLYTFMDEGKIPYFKIGAHRRFMAKQVMKAIKDMQTAQIHAELYDNRPRETLAGA